LHFLASGKTDAAKRERNKDKKEKNRLGNMVSEGRRRN
jgi:hypothetical protein